MTSPTEPEGVALDASVRHVPAHERTIAVFAPTGNDALLTQRILAASDILVRICSGITELCQTVEGACAAILLAEETLKTNAVLTLVESLARQPPWSDLPVIIITSGGEADQARLRRLAVFGPGANVTLLERPFRPGTLLSTAQAALRSRMRQYLIRDLLQELMGLTKKVRDQARTFDATLSHITDFAYTFDLQGRFTYINKPLLDLWGLKLEQAVGKDFFELNYPAELAQKLQDQIQQVIRTRKSLIDETPYTNPAGQPGFYEYIFNPIFASDGTVEAVAGSTRDISERKQTEARLRNSDAQVTAIIDHSPVGVYLLDGDLRFQRLNQKARPVFAAAGDPVGRPLGAVLRSLWPPQVAAELEARFRHTLATGEPYFESGFAADRADQPKHEHYDWQINRIRLTDGSFGVVCYFIDVSGHVAAQQKIREARDAAEQASRAKDDFLAALSHELRTPLNPVLLLASESAADPTLTPELRQIFDMIAKNVMLEAHLIDDLLDLTRITRGKLVLDSRPVAAHDILRDAIANVTTEVTDKNLVLTLDFGVDEPVVHGDPVRLQQVFWNVLKNAAKFTPQGGGIHVTSRLNASPGMLTVEITDTGAGMNGEELKRIFDAFAQGDHASAGSSHRFGGLGLGLAISRSLVELHSGVIRASSPGLGRGSTFTIELPTAAAVIMDRPASRVATPAHRGSSSPVPGLRILLVEDHAPTRAILAQLLQARNYLVVSAASVGEGRKFGTTQTFDLLITDIGLPDGNGYELMEELGKLRSLPGIALTGYGAEQDVARAQKAGFVAHLTKPISVRTLDGVLDSLASGALVGLKVHSPPK